MNKERRKLLEKAYDLLFEAREGESNALSHMPESLIVSERGQKMDETIGDLDEMCDKLEEMLNE